MTGKNWIKAITTAAIVAAASVPMISNASTHYTGKVPASIAMMAPGSDIPAASPVTLAPTTTRKHSKHRAHHTAVKKASTSKHKLAKKHRGLKGKKA